MRILFVCRRYWPAVGGVESFVRRVARELAGRHELLVLAHRTDDGPTTRLTDSVQPPPRFEPFEDGAARVTPLHVPVGRRAMMAPLGAEVLPGFRRYSHGRLRGPAAALYARAVSPVIAQHAQSVDVVHMWGGDYVAAATVRAARSAGKPVAITPFTHKGQWGDDPGSAAAFRKADKVVGLLDVDAEVYRELGVAPERLAVSGVCSPPLPFGGGREIRQRYDISGPLVLFLAARRPYKGVDIVLDAAPIVARHRPEVTFAFLGPGPALPDAPPDTRILDIGEVDDEARAAWLDAASMICLPSAGEIFPTSFLEAWSLKTPVVTSQIPTLEELITKSGGGVTVPRDAASVASTILELLADERKLEALGEAGYAFWSNRYSVTALGEWHERLYAELLSERPANGGSPYR